MYTKFEGDNSEEHLFTCEVCGTFIVQNTNKPPQGWQVTWGITDEDTECFCPDHKK